MQIMGVDFTIGADPEVFVRDEETKRFVGAHGLMAGTKAKPIDISYYCKGQVDGMALEFNTHPSGRVSLFAYYVLDGKEGLNRELHCQERRRKIVVQPTVEFDEEEWARAPDKAKLLGCEHDYCAWGGIYINEPPNAMVKFRTGAGHIHTGWGNGFDITDEFKKICGAFVREQDALNGVASLLYDQDTKRRELYGKAGAFRPKSYGVEYRTLSNSWVRNKALTEYVARRTFQAARNMMKGTLVQVEQVETIINNNQVEEAKYFLDYHNITYPPAKYRVV